MNSDHALFQVLLRSLTDFSEGVVRRDLQLLAQISHSSDDSYFNKFMINLLTLFTSDRRLLDTRGGMIIRQLCLHLNPERMYRSFGEILEHEAVLFLYSFFNVFLGFGICYYHGSNFKYDHGHCP